MIRNQSSLVNYTYTYTKNIVEQNIGLIRQVNFWFNIIWNNVVKVFVAQIKIPKKVIH